MPETPKIHRPIPRRTFEISPASAESSAPPSPNPDNTNPDLLEAKLHSASPPSRTRSVLNLTSSTLLGIYSPTSYGAPREESSHLSEAGNFLPCQRQGTDLPQPPLVAARGNKPLSRAASDHPGSGPRVLLLPFLFRASLLFVIGVAYGTLITHLHDHQNLAPVRVEAFDRHSGKYVLAWGLAGVALGSLQPWVDFWCSGSVFPNHWPSGRLKQACLDSSADVDTERPGSGTDWTPVVRSIGAFVGIAFAIRKLPWQSTLQVSVTLALVNPVLWYLVDRSKPGFVLSSGVGVVGTLILSEINPNIVPSPTIHTLAENAETATNITSCEGKINALISQESVGTWTWIASVLFCSCVCFGNIGRKLAPGQRSAIS